MRHIPQKYHSRHAGLSGRFKGFFQLFLLFCFLSCDLSHILIMPGKYNYQYKKNHTSCTGYGSQIVMDKICRRIGNNIFNVSICMVQSAIAPKTTQSVIQNPCCHGVSPPSVQMFLFNNSSSNLNCEVTEQLHYFFRFIPS